MATGEARRVGRYGTTAVANTIPLDRAPGASRLPLHPLPRPLRRHRVRHPLAHPADPEGPGRVGRTSRRRPSTRRSRPPRPGRSSTATPTRAPLPGALRRSPGAARARRGARCLRGRSPPAAWWCSRSRREDRGRRAHRGAPHQRAGEAHAPGAEEGLLPDRAQTSAPPRATARTGRKASPSPGGPGERELRDRDPPPGPGGQRPRGCGRGRDRRSDPSLPRLGDGGPAHLRGRGRRRHGAPRPPLQHRPLLPAGRVGSPLRRRRDRRPRAGPLSDVR